MSFWDWMTANEAVLEPGKGLFSPLHIILMIALTAHLIGMYFLFKKHPNFSKKLIFWMVIVMLSSRVFRMIFRVSVGADSFFESFPWELCHIMCLAISIAYFMKAKKGVLAISIYAMMGGILTFIFGDYYQYSVLTFYDIESILLHILLPTVALYNFMTIKPKFNYSSIFSTAIALLLLVCYAEMGNTIFGDTNFMFIRENGLTFQLTAGSHIWTYIILFLSAISIGCLAIYLNDRKKKKALASAESGDVIPLVIAEEVIETEKTKKA